MISRFEAAQIAILLNKYSNLDKEHTAKSLLSSKLTTYYPVSVHGLVVASVAVKRYSVFISEIKHLVVHPIMRGKGLGRQLVKETISRITTPLMCATIRTENSQSLNIFKAEKFVNISTIDRGDHSVLFLMRAK